MDNNKIKVDMVDMQEAIQDQNAEFMMEGEASIDAIPDLDKLTENIFAILSFLERPGVKQICETNESAIRMKLINDYAETVPLKFIDLFMEKDPNHKRESIERTMRWIETLAKVKAGDLDLEKASQSLVDEVNNRYVYSKYGSKEKFEEALQKELAKGGQGTAVVRDG